jgi:hypothetical protein
LLPDNPLVVADDERVPADTGDGFGENGIDAAMNKAERLKVAFIHRKTTHCLSGMGHIHRDSHDSS